MRYVISEEMPYTFHFRALAEDESPNRSGGAGTAICGKHVDHDMPYSLTTWRKLDARWCTECEKKAKDA